MTTNSGPPPEGAWSKRFKWGFDKSISISDWASDYANAVSAKVGGERFWPKSNDMPEEIEKCERILRAFTVEGVPQKEEKEEKVQDGKGNWITKKRKVMKKIPPSAIKNAKGICIYSSMRSGIAPFGGGGGAGIVLARLPDGSWSAPSSVTPNNMSAGLLLGMDFLDVVLLINSEKALQSFLSHKFTIGAETGLTAGPWGAGTSAESGFERAPIYSYVRTRGAFAGIEIMGQAFLHRFDENERFYYWPGVKAEDILTGKVRMPPLIVPLHRALRDAELGVAQGGKLERVVYDVVKMPESEVMKMLGPNQGKKSKRFVASGTASAATSASSTPAISTPHELENGEEKEVLKDLDEDKFKTEEDEEEDVIKDGERLRLPPTPEELEMLERAGIPDQEDVRLEQEEREKVYRLPPPPMHVQVKRYWRVRPELAAKRRTEQLVMDGPHSAEIRVAQYIPLPPSPRSSMELREEEEAKEKSQEEEAERQAKRETYTIHLEEEGVLMQEVDEKEADKLMEAAVKGEDVQELKDTGEVEKMGKDSKEEEEEQSELPTSEEAKQSVDVGHDEAVKSAEGEEDTIKSNGEIEAEVEDKVQTEESNGALENKLTAASGNTATQDKKLESEEDNSQDLEDAFSSPRASLNLSSGQAGNSSNNSPRPSLSEDTAANKAEKTPPSRPPRNRPPRRKKP